MAEGVRFLAKMWAEPREKCGFDQVDIFFIILVSALSWLSVDCVSGDAQFLNDARRQLQTSNAFFHSRHVK